MTAPGAVIDGAADVDSPIASRHSGDGPASTVAARGMAGDIAWSVVAAAVTATLGLATLAISAHLVGLRQFGVYAVADAVAVLALTCSSASAAALVPLAAREADGDGTARPQLIGFRRSYRWAALAVPLVTVAASPLVAGVLGQHGPACWRFVVTEALLAGCAGLTLFTTPHEAAAIGRRHYRRMFACDAAGAIAVLAVVTTAAPEWGIPALGAARLIGALADRGSLMVWMRRECWWLRQVGHAGSGNSRLLLSLGAPLIVVGVGMQIVVLTDNLVVGGLVGAGAVGAYRVAASLPTQATALLFRGYDVVLPRLARSSALDEQLDVTRFLTRVAGFVCGAGLGTIAWQAAAIMHLLTGTNSSLGAHVLAVFSAVWLVNTAVHGQVMMLVARGQQGLLTRLVVAETVANAVLTLGFVASMGALGAALATLLVVVLSNGVLLPACLGHSWTGASRGITRRGVTAGFVGVVVAAGASAVADLVPGSWRLPVAFVTAAVFGWAVGVAMLRSRGRATLRGIMFSTSPVNAELT